jgi:hypothetical protein
MLDLGDQIRGCDVDEVAGSKRLEEGHVELWRQIIGDVEAGRQAFLDLRCTACHAVPSESGFPAPVSANPGPPIDVRLASRDVSYLMASIMTPSHAISTNIGDEMRARLSGVLSPMGDFSRVMTVRQLVDLHAYIRSVK